MVARVYMHSRTKSVSVVILCLLKCNMLLEKGIFFGSK